MLINQELLRTLVDAATAPTFAEAAKKRHVTPSAVSQQMKTLETQLGLRLFERIGRRAKLTSSGEALVSVLRREFAAIDDAIDVLIADRDRPKGIVKIGAPRPFARVYLRPRLAEILRMHPEIVLDVAFDRPTPLEIGVAERLYDLAILARPPESPLVEGEPIAVERFAAVASPGYVRARGMPETKEAFLDARYIVFSDELPMHAPWWRASFGKKTPLPTSIVCRIASLDEMLALAEAGLGIAVLPSYFVEESLAKKRLLVLWPPKPKPGALTRTAENTLHLVWRKGAIETARFRLVRDAILAGALR